MATHMQSLFGKAGLEQAYQFMGRRLAGCSTGDGPQAFGAMMGMMGGGMMGASYGYGTGGYGSNSYAPGYMMGGRHGPGMMGGYPYQSTGGSGLSAGAIVGIVLGGIAVLGLAVFAGTGLARRSARPPQAHGS